MILKRGQKAIYILLTTIFVLSFFVGMSSTKAATTDIIEGVTLTSGKDNELSYADAGKVAGFSCTFDKEIELSTKYNKAVFKCTWNKILTNKKSVSYKIIYPNAEDGGAGYDSLHEYSYVDKTTETITNSSDSASKLETKDLTVYYKQNDTLAGAIRPKIKLIVSYANDSSESSITNSDDVLDTFSGTFVLGKGGGAVFDSDYNKITIKGNPDVDRPDIVFSLKKITRYRGGLTDNYDFNMFYYYSDNDKFKDLAIRIAHNIVGTPDNNNNQKTCSKDKATYTYGDIKFVTMDIGNNALPDTTNTKVNNSANIYIETEKYWVFLDKHYSDAKANICPSFDNIEYDNFSSAIKDNSNIINGDNDTDPTVGNNALGKSSGKDIYDTTTGKCYDIKNNSDIGVADIISPIAGVGCYLGQGALNGTEWLYNLAGSGGLSDALVLGTASMENNSTLRMVWKTIRDIINSLFLALFLFSIFVTVLKIDTVGNLGSWQMKKFLPTIITSMILINFSLSIANLIVEISNRLVEAFLPGSGYTAGGLVPLESMAMFSVAETTLIGVVLKFIIGLVFALIMFYLWAVLWVRKYVVFLLLMFSAAPYIGNVLPIPQIQEYTKKWSSEFMKWIFIGPATALILFITSAAIGSIGDFEKPVMDTKNTGLDLGGYIGQLLIVGILLYIAATLPIKMGGKITQGVSDFVTGKKGLGKDGKYNPMVKLRKGIEKDLETRKENKSAKIQGRIARGIEKKGSIIDRAYGTMAKPGLKAQSRLDEAKARNVQATKAVGKAYGKENPKAFTNIEIDEEAEKIKASNSTASLKDQVFNGKTPKDVAAALSALQKIAKEKAGTQDGVDAENAIVDIASKTGIIDGNNPLNINTDINQALGEKIKSMSIKTGLGVAATPKDLKESLDKMSQIEIDALSPLSITGTQKDAMAGLYSGELSNTKINEAILGATGLSANDIDSVAIRNSGGDKATIENILKNKLGEDKFKEISGKGEYQTMLDTVKQRTNLDRLSLVNNKGNSYNNASFVRDALEQGKMSGRSGAEIESEISSQISAINSALARDKNEATNLAKKYFATSYIGRSNISEEELRMHMGNLSDAITNGKNEQGELNVASVGNYMENLAKSNTKK